MKRQGDSDEMSVAVTLSFSEEPSVLVPPLERDA
jgi:hypothetical protein